MYHKVLNHHPGDLYVYKNDLLLYYYAYGPFPCGSRLCGSPVLYIIHNSGYIFIFMHIAL